MQRQVEWWVLVEASQSFRREDLAGVFDALPLAIAVIGPDRTLLLANRATQQFVGQREDALLGRVGGEALHCANSGDVPKGCGFGPDCVRCRLRQFTAQTLEQRVAVTRQETSQEFANAGLRHLRVSTLPIIYEGKDSALLALEDITELKSQEETRLANERLAAAVKTGGAVCHEMNQPLTAMALILDRLQKSTGPEDPRHAGLGELQTLFERLSALTWKLMHLTSFETMEYVGQTSILDIDRASGSSPKTKQ